MGPNEILDKNFIPDDEVTLFRVVEQTDVDHCEEVDTAGADWVGIAQEEADELDVYNRRVIRVRTQGISRGIASGPISLRARVSATANGRLGVATAGHYVVGIAVSPAAAEGDWFNVQLTPGVQLPA